jgi:hypothetical protein
MGSFGQTNFVWSTLRVVGAYDKDMLRSAQLREVVQMRGVKRREEDEEEGKGTLSGLNRSSCTWMGELGRVESTAVPKRTHLPVPN